MELYIYIGILCTDNNNKLLITPHEKKKLQSFKNSLIRTIFTNVP